MTMQTLVDASPVLRRISVQELSLRTLYRVGMLFDKLEYNLKFYDSQRAEIMRECCTETEGRFVPRPGKEAEVERRFRELLEYYEIEADLEEVPQLYVEALSHQAPLLPGAKKAVQELAAILPIAIVTNGIPYVQHGRFDRSELRPYIQELVISGEEGFFKPDPRLIEVALRRMNCSKERALMVGDSLGSDILGAQRAGVDSCWYNPAAKPCTLEKEPDYTIKDLKEIKKILNGEE